MNNISIVKKAQKGDDEAFVELIEIYKEYLFKISCVYLKDNGDSADAIQETILSMYEKIDSIKNPRYFKTWMTKILINKCNDTNKRKKSVVQFNDYIENNYYESMDVSQIEFRSIIEPLQENYRIVILLHYLQQFSVKEISEILDIPQGTVKSRLYRGREILKERYRKDNFISKEGVCNE